MNFFIESLLSMSPVQLDGKIQGFKLREDALLKNGVNQVVSFKTNSPQGIILRACLVHFIFEPPISPS